MITDEVRNVINQYELFNVIFPPSEKLPLWHECQNDYEWNLNNKLSQKMEINYIWMCKMSFQSMK